MKDFKHPAAKFNGDSNVVGLAPQELQDHASPLDSTSNLKVDDSQSATIEFSGGGGIMSIEFDQERVDHLSKMWHSPLQHATNEDSSLVVGGHASFVAEGGFGLLAGIEADASISYTADVSHRILQSDDVESSTSIYVEFGDRECLLASASFFL